MERLFGVPDGHIDLFAAISEVLPISGQLPIMKAGRERALVFLGDSGRFE